MSVVNGYYHVVINTFNRSCNLWLENIEELYRYISGIIANHRSQLIAINGTTNHIHMLINLHQSTSLADLMRDVKRSSSIWMSNHPAFRKFNGWGREYFAFSCSARELPAIKQYIANQREHHGFVNFEEEIQRITQRNEVTWHEKMLT